jgi:hypothetical protein
MHPRVCTHRAPHPPPRCVCVGGWVSTLVWGGGGGGVPLCACVCGCVGVCAVLTLWVAVFSVCVETCPTEWLNITDNGVDIDSAICTYGVRPTTFAEFTNYTSLFLCGPFVYPTVNRTARPRSQLP